MSTTVSNSYANKPTIVSGLASYLSAAGDSNSNYVDGNTPVLRGVTQVTGTSKNVGYVIQNTFAADMYIGACWQFDLSSNSIFTIVASCSADGTISESAFDPRAQYFVVDYPTASLLDATERDGTLITTSSNIYRDNTGAPLINPSQANSIQDLILLFLNNPSSAAIGGAAAAATYVPASGTSRKLYSFILAASVRYFNSAATPMANFYKSGVGRILGTIDDGSVYFDATKCSTLTSDGTFYSAGSNTWVNFINKIKIAQHGTKVLTTSNQLTITNSATMTVGTAGGNNINENHHTRPEMLLALLSSNGTGFAQRFSTSSQDFLLYYAVRLGTVTELNYGSVRISVPLTIKV